MKATYMRSAAALAVILGLSACGGKASFDVSGTVSGLTTSGLKMKNNDGDEITVPAGATSFRFPKTLNYGDQYNVTFSQQPQHLTCGPGNNVPFSATAGLATYIYLSVSCIRNAYDLGGIVIGLTSDDTLILINGSTGGSVTLKKGDGTFIFTNKVEVGTPYGITVQKQPAGLTCTVKDGTDVMGDAPRNNSVVTCVPNK